MCRDTISTSKTVRSWITDQEGAECSDLDHAAATAMELATQAAAACVANGESTVRNLDSSVVVADDTGKLVMAAQIYSRIP